MKVTQYRTAFKTAFLAGLLVLSGNCIALDIDAKDYVPAPEGTNLALLYLQYADAGRLYDDGNRVPGDNELESQIGIFRAVHFMKLGDMTIDPQVLIPYGRVEGKGDLSEPLGQETGFADPLLAATFWVQENHETGEYTGITPYIVPPVGTYDNEQPLNLGNNRWEFILQGAHTRKLTENLWLDLSLDMAHFGDNNQSGPDKQKLERDVLWQMQGFLTYDITSTSDLRFKLSHSLGGETEIDGVRQDDRIQRTKFEVGGSFFVTKTFQVLAMYGQDIENENSFSESNRVNVRLLQIF